MSLTIRNGRPATRKGRPKRNRRTTQTKWKWRKWTMANEITIQGAVSLQRSPVSVVGSDSKPINQTGTNGVANLVAVGYSGGSASTVTFSFTVGYLFVKNNDTTNTVLLALDSAMAQVFGKLRPGEFCMIPPNVSTFYA